MIYDIIILLLLFGYYNLNKKINIILKNIKKVDDKLDFTDLDLILESNIYCNDKLYDNNMLDDKKYHII